MQILFSQQISLKHSVRWLCFTTADFKCLRTWQDIYVDKFGGSELKNQLIVEYVWTNGFIAKAYTDLYSYLEFTV